MKSTFKAVIATILCYLILMTNLSVLSFTVYAESVAVSGSGSEQSPYLIYTAEEFAYAMTNYGKMKGVFISLENDIELTSYVPDDFAATLDGNYHKIISNIHLATTNSGMINKLVFENSNPYTGGSYAGIGALCTSNNGVISNTLVTAQITNSYNAAIIAYSGTGSILNCAALGSISTYDGDGSKAAGIAFSQGEIANCYVAATISATGSSRYGVSYEYPISASKFTDSYFDKTLYTDTDAEVKGYTTEFMKSADFINILNENAAPNCSAWALDSENKNNGYPVLKDALNTDITSSKKNYLISGIEYIELGFEEGIEVYYTTDGSEPNTSSSKYTAPIEVDDDVIITAKGYMNGLAGLPKTFRYAKVDGDGSAENPYLIECEADFRAIAELSEYAHFSLTTDIDLAGDISTFGDFYGVFEGNNHTINNISSVANSYIYGLFKNNYGVIQNLNITNSRKGLYSNGVFAFKNYGLISCSAYQGDLYADSKGANDYERYQNYAPYYYGSGGFVSFNYGSIKNSKFIGDLIVKTGNSVGGFVGVNNGCIDNCLFEGNINVKNTFSFGEYTDSNCASGFAGYNTESGTIKNSTAHTDTIRIDISSYTGSNIYTFFKGYQNVENCLDIYNSLTISRNYIEWGTVNIYQQNLAGEGNTEFAHEHHYALTMTNPTCTETGHSVFICNTCGDSFEYSEIPALGHDYIMETVQSTYESEGYTIRTCARCDLNEIIDIVPQFVQVNGACGDGLTYSLDTGTGILSISGSGAMTNYSSSNAPWYQYRRLIKTILIENGVDSIGSYAFCNFTNLAEVDIAASVKSFGANCFNSATALKKTTYHGTIDEWATISFSDSANPTVFSKNLFINDEEITEIVLSNGLKEIKSKAFEGLRNVTKIVIPDSVEAISSYAFGGCIGLTDLTMPCSATISNNSFYDCYRLKKMTLTKGTGMMASYDSWYLSGSSFTTLILSDGIESISDNAFLGCYNLEFITFPDNSYSVGSRAFAGTKWIKNQADENGLYIIDNKLIDASAASGNVVIPNTVTEIGEYALASGNIKSVTIPDSVVTIGDDALGSGIEKLIIPCSFNNYTEKAFEKCTGLTELVMTKGTGIMPSFNYSYTPWFFSAKNLKKITLEDGVTNIVNSAFSGLEQLTEISISDTVLSVGSGAFSYDKSIAKLVLPDSIQSISGGAFNHCTGLKELTMPCSATIANLYSFGNCTNIEKITLTKGTGTMPSFVDNYKCTPWYISRTALKTFVIEEGITNIGAFMFYGNTEVAAVTLPNSITSIGSSAFSGCTNLANITIPGSVSSIGNFAFNDCTSLKTIDIPDKLTVLESSVFGGCTSLTAVTLPEGLENIKVGCFKNCGITEIYIPATVTNIGNNAFSNCNALEAVFVQSRDCKIYSGASVFPTNAVIYGCSGSTAETYASKYSRTFVTMLAIYFNPNGGTTPIQCKAVANNSVYGELPVPIKDGYIFKGWFTSPDGGVQIKRDTQFTITEDQTLYAVWELMPTTETTVIKKSNYSLINISVHDLNQTANVVLATYKDGILSDMQVEEYHGQDLALATFYPYDTIKVMLWENLETMRPLNIGEVLQ